LPQWFSDHAVTHCFIPTPILDTVLQEAWPPECRLRTVLTGGDKLRRGVPRGLPFAVFNQYGPTENAVVSTSVRVAEEDADTGGSAPPIGRPVSNVELFVMDRHGELVAVGVPGELWIGGASLARGYRNAPELTAERFVPHPFKAGARVYKSGDLVRYLPDGNLEFLGRSDEQIKIRGFRIEPGEIESVLAREPNVQTACVLVRADTPEGEPLLVAYLVAKPEAALDVALLRAQAREKLPAYMVPSHFVVVEAFPLTANGKIDRARLPLPATERRDGDERHAAPRTQLEEWIASIWRQELHLDAVGIDENFFDVGGTSLTLVRIQRQLEEKLPEPLPVVDLFRYPTIRSLAAHLDNRDGQQTSVEKARERAATRRKRVRRPAAGELR
jgi:acyl-CoA synthetase (AMP-forming)/AMP-acid ligase II